MTELGIRCDHFLSMAKGKAEATRDVFVGISGGRIAEVSPWKGQQAARLIDARGQVVMPGLVNAHTHLPMTLLRGLEDDLPLQKWLFERIIPLEAKLVDPEFVRAGTWLAAMECIRFGVTTVCDMYFYADEIAQVLDQAGLRGRVGQVFLSAPTPEDRDYGTDKTAVFGRFFEKWRSHPRVSFSLSPHAPYTCNDDTLREVARVARESGAWVQIHLCENAGEVADSRRSHGKTPVRRLFDLGVLQERAICAHSVHLSEDDMELMLKAGASVVYNPDSNLKLSSGIAPVASYFKRGIPVALGTDGSASNNDLSLFGAMDVGTKLQKLSGGDNTAMVASDALRIATWEGARAIGLGDEIGSIEVGKRADLICVDLDFPHLQPVYDVRSQLVYAAQGLEVDTVICEGRVLMQAKKFVALDPAQVYADVEVQRARVLRELA